ncbi:hypothetical protein CDAR_21871 [Caerostris darwini]|uniref:Uncharacterized protein n=1 Tax=Caerostris darwini TaxID=1538125 RepID=A0AAV4VX14_9ARAC|nr:hypothetical protein CDAR_21871 [Caerostris darwini]
MAETAWETAHLVSGPKIVRFKTSHAMLKSQFPINIVDGNNQSVGLTFYWTLGGVKECLTPFPAVWCSPWSVRSKFAMEQFHSHLFENYKVVY